MYEMGARVETAISLSHNRGPARWPNRKAKSSIDLLLRQGAELPSLLRLFVGPFSPYLCTAFYTSLNFQLFIYLFSFIGRHIFTAKCVKKRKFDKLGSLNRVKGGKNFEGGVTSGKLFYFSYSFFFLTGNKKFSVFSFCVPFSSFFLAKKNCEKSFFASWTIGGEEPWLGSGVN